MSYIYPECPSCDRKSDDGVPVHEMPVFDYDCPHCGFAERGRFVREPYPHVEWTGRSLDGQRGYKSSGIIRSLIERLL